MDVLALKGQDEGEMKVIEVSDETFEALKARVRDFGETPESVIRRLLAVDHESSLKCPSEVSLDESTALRELMSSNRFQHLNGRDRYFEILKFLHKEKPEEFARKLPGLKFGKRIQIAMDAETIEKSGKSTFPVKIQDTPYWALSNLSNRSKRDVIFSAMRMLGYDDALIRLAVQGIPDSSPERSSIGMMGGKI
ncbi:MAG: hypothetical protein V4689_06355 [Verrucomicrobiota bacterium]